MKNKKIITLLVIIILAMMIFSGCDANPTTTDFSGDKMALHFIDVGQGDSTLIIFPNEEVALIDAGTRSGRKDIVKYLKNLNIKKIDYLIGTHPHEDHIGGLPEIIRNFEIEKVYLPNKTNNTKIFEELLTEIQNKNLKISEGKTGVKIIDNEELKFYIVAPSKEYNNINNNSIVTKIVYKDFSSVITGDAEKELESDMIQEGHDLKSDVLRVGHHGSSTSTTEEFLDLVNPDYAIISLGRDNAYGHPHKEVIDLLEGNNIEILRTDELGHILIETDGRKLSFSTKNPGNFNLNEENIGDESNSKEGVYIGNINSKILHSDNCNSLPSDKNQVVFSTKAEALAEGYQPHSVCLK